MNGNTMQTKADLFIASNGNDQWSGRYDTPLADGSDGPLLSLEMAKSKVQQLDQEEVTVLIREGTYFFDETVVFGLEDGRGEGGRVSYAAYECEHPIFSSGIHLNHWEKVVQQDILETLPSQARDRVYRMKLPNCLDTVLTMFDGDEQLVRAHGPFFKHSKVYDYQAVDSLNVANQEDRVLLRKVDFEEGQIKDWPNISDVELRFMPVPWTMNLIPLESVDMKNRVAWLDREATAPLCAKGDGIRVENVIEYMTEPGMWCVSTQAGYVYYWPKETGDGKVDLDHVYVPSLQEFIRVEGDVDLMGPVDQPVKNIHFEGLTFIHGKTDRVAKGYKGTGIQHDWEMYDKGTALLRFRGAESCSVKGCHFHSTSGSGIRLDLHCQKILIENNLFNRIGIMGVLLCGYGPGSKDVNKNNCVRNNIITRCGEEYWHGHGIFLWQSGQNLIENNHIYDSARKAIGLCGVRVTILIKPGHAFDEASKTIRWHEIDKSMDQSLEEDVRYLPFLHTRNNVVKNNEVSNVLLKIADGAAINVSGAGEGNHILNNYIHHLSTYKSSGAVRVDDWQRGTTIEGNIVYMSNGCGFTRKNYNHLINNIVVDVNCRKGYLRFASYPNERAAYGSMVRNNIFYDTGDEAIFFHGGYLISKGASQPRNCNIDDNVYYVSDAPKAGQEHLQHFRKEGIESHSLNADPMFEDITRQNFGLKKESPALALGFTPIDQSLIGLRDDYPEYLKNKAPEADLSGVYDRGTDKAIEAYEWW